MNEDFKKCWPIGQHGVKNTLRNQPGCYVLETADGRKYVGSTGDIAGRISGHVSDLKLGRRTNPSLAQSYTVEPKFKVSIFPTVTVEQARQKEQETLNDLVAQAPDMIHNRGIVNVNKPMLGVQSVWLGTERSEESRERMSQSQRRRLSDLVNQQGLLDHMAMMRAARINIQQEVMCAGQKYNSMAEAARALGISTTALWNRCRSENYPDFYKVPRDEYE